jgi:23S rRNA pseudouridine1911/1915/1917 synthase
MDNKKEYIFKSYKPEIKCPIGNKNPFVMKNLKDIYYIYKPAYWNCITYCPSYKNILTDINENKIKNNLIVEWIRENLFLDKDIANYQYNFGMVNRLDLETSGIIIVAKNLKTFEHYKQTINEHQKTTKIYIALVSGEIKYLFGIITLPLYIDENQRRTYVDYKKGKPSYTEYIKLATYEKGGANYSLLMVKIKTGRTHQIRVHLKNIGHNILCDTKYENPSSLKNSCNITSRLFLHAYYYKINDNNFALACLPKDLQTALDNLEINRNYYDIHTAIKILSDNVITNSIFAKKNIEQISKGAISTKTKKNTKQITRKNSNNLLSLD